MLQGRTGEGTATIAMGVPFFGAPIFKKEEGGMKRKKEYNINKTGYTVDLRLENFPWSVSSSIFCMDLLSAFNIARFKFQGSGSNTLEIMNIYLNHIKLNKFQENL